MFVGVICYHFGALKMFLGVMCYYFEFYSCFKLFWCATGNEFKCYLKFFSIKLCFSNAYAWIYMQYVLNFFNLVGSYDPPIHDLVSPTRSYLGSRVCLPCLLGCTSQQKRIND